MKYLMAILAIFLSAIFLLSGFSATVNGGVEPSPFRDDIGQLTSMVNELDSINHRVDCAADFMFENEGKNLRGQAHRVSAAANQVELVTERLEKLLEELQEEVPQPPGGPYEDDLQELAVLGFAMHYRVNMLLDTISDWSEYDGEVTPSLYELADAMMELLSSARELMNIVYGLLYLVGPYIR